ncbi:MAG: glycogen synthase [Nitrospirota bacterium]
MKILILTNEYPPHVYGGAGVHVDYLTREIAAIGGHDINVLCFGEQKEHKRDIKVQGVRINFSFPYQDAGRRKFLETLFRNIIMVGSVSGADLIHSHTWYVALAGCLLKRMLNVPYVITAHSLEPQRPWKEEQLGLAYRASKWLEESAFANADGIITLSEYMKRSVHGIYKIPFDKIRVIPNGLDVNEYRPTYDPNLIASYGVSPDRPFILFVGRITRQKGIFHLLNAIKHFESRLQVVLIAADPDTQEVGSEMKMKIQAAQADFSGRIIWIDRFIRRHHLIVFYSHASAFVCPSIYEPFGIINLEAMSCETPVVASAVGGIPEVVVDGETGILVPFEPKNSTDNEPQDPEKFSRDLADAINSLITSPDRRRAMGNKAREIVTRHYSWQNIARQTLDFYEEIKNPKVS